MTEIRRLRLKIGEVEFEAEVPENEVQPMFCQFLSMLGRRGQTPVRLASEADDHWHSGGRDAAGEATFRVESIVESLGRALDRSALTHIFEVRQDGAVTLKVLPTGPDQNADVMLLLLYGYYRLKNEEYVLATQLFRSAEQSGISIRRPAREYTRNAALIVRGGQRKGSHYSLNQQGLAMAQEISTRIIAASIATGRSPVDLPSIQS
jgi:hypothetical protein